MFYILISFLRTDRDEPISASLFSGPSFVDSPLVLRFQPHLTLQAEKPSTPWANKKEVEDARYFFLNIKMHFH